MSQKILKVVAYFFHTTPEGVRWDFHEGELLGPDDLRLRGLDEATLARWMERGHLAETEAAVEGPGSGAFAAVESILASRGDYAATVDEDGA